MGAFAINVQAKSLYGRSRINQIALILLFFLFGAAIAVVRANIRVPLHLPGRHGIEVMFLFTFLRLIIPYRWAGTFMGTGAAFAAFFPVLGFGDPFMPLMFAMPGVGLDLFLDNVKLLRKHLVFVALAAGFCYLSIPVVRGILSLFGVVYGSLAGGLWYPLLTHFMFGTIGGFLGASFSKIKR